MSAAVVVAAAVGAARRLGVPVRDPAVLRESSSVIVLLAPDVVGFRGRGGRRAGAPARRLAWLRSQTN